MESTTARARDRGLGRHRPVRLQRPLADGKRDRMPSPAAAPVPVAIPQVRGSDGPRARRSLPQGQSGRVRRSFERRPDGFWRQPVPLLFATARRLHATGSARVPAPTSRKYPAARRWRPRIERRVSCKTPRYASAAAPAMSSSVAVRCASAAPDSARARSTPARRLPKSTTSHESSMPPALPHTPSSDSVSSTGPEIGGSTGCGSSSPKTLFRVARFVCHKKSRRGRYAVRATATSANAAAEPALASRIAG